MNNKLGINKKEGFTLAELLIVVAIIAVLVAIAIPVFNKQIEKAREAYDIYTMRQAASAAIDLYYAGVNDEVSATANGLKWWPDDNPNKRNAAGVYVPTTGKFLPLRSSDDETKKMVYGKGTTIKGGTQFTLGNERGAYNHELNYTNAVVMIAIYPDGNNKHVDIYWKGTDGKYIGGEGDGKSDPKYSIRISLQ